MNIQDIIIIFIAFSFLIGREKRYISEVFTRPKPVTKPPNCRQHSLILGSETKRVIKPEPPTKCPTIPLPPLPPPPSRVG